MAMHRINRIEIELQAQDVPLAQALSERAGRMHPQRIAPVVDRVCGELSGGEAVERIDRLELDLGVVAAEDFEEDFVEKLEPALRAALAAALRRQAGRQPGRSSLELLETFALTGNLPWWADAPDRRVVADHFVRAAGAAKQGLLALLRRIAVDPGALDRMARACDGDALEALAGREAVDVKIDVAGRRALLSALAGEGPGRDAERGQSARRWAAQEAANPGAAGHDAAAHDEAGREAAAGAGPRAGGEPAGGEPAQETAPARPSLAGQPTGVPTGARPSPSVAVIAGARRSALERLDEVYVDDAGLVILWPFLQRFFTRAGLLDDDRRFVDEAAVLQAVALIERLATDEPEPLEFQLALPKLLCGRPLESDFRLERPLTPEQLAEGEHLLTAVIDRARALGDASIPSFRVNFLKRRGALTTRDGAWLLQVERQAHDLLLDRFPWSWGWVKLPWMPDPLRVEW